MRSTNEKFLRCLSILLQHEGGFVDHSQDPGGATNMGITLYTYRRVYGPQSTVDDLRVMDETMAAAIYADRYWDAIEGDGLPAGLDLVLFTIAVMSGPRVAVKHLQRMLGVDDDGLLGPVTRAALSSQHRASAHMVTVLCEAYRSWLARLPAWKVFGTGWTNRINDVEAKARTMTQCAA